MHGRLAAITLLLGSTNVFASNPIDVVRTPEGGIQPQAVIDDRGVVHLIFFKGDPSHGDLHYARREPGQHDFMPSIRVDRESGSAVATGTIRGGQIAIGRSGWIHVVWNGSRPDFKTESALYYARLNPETNEFESKRNVMTSTISLDGGGSIAADREGRVYLAWHARGKGEPEGEVHRRLRLARSTDDGTTISPERAVSSENVGACACCGTKASVDTKGSLYLMFRAAAKGTERDLFLLRSSDGGNTFVGGSIHPWHVNACPMSSSSLSVASADPLAAWETMGQVYFMRAANSRITTDPIAPPGNPGNRKHPSIATGPNGSILLAWTEGTGWQKGGALVWRLFDASGKPTELSGRVDRGIPVWGLPTAVARPDGHYLIIH